MKLETLALNAMREALANGGDDAALLAAGRKAAERAGVAGIAADVLAKRVFDNYFAVKEAN